MNPDFSWMIEYTKRLVLIGFEVPAESKDFVDAEMTLLASTFYKREMHPNLINEIVSKFEEQLRMLLSLNLIQQKELRRMPPS